MFITHTHTLSDLIVSLSLMRGGTGQPVVWQSEFQVEQPHLVYSFWAHYHDTRLEFVLEPPFGSHESYILSQMVKANDSIYISQDFSKSVSSPLIEETVLSNMPGPPSNKNSKAPEQENKVSTTQPENRYILHNSGMWYCFQKMESRMQQIIHIQYLVVLSSFSYRQCSP